MWFSTGYDLKCSYYLDFVLGGFNDRFRDRGRFELNFRFLLVHKCFVVEIPVIKIFGY